MDKQKIIDLMECYVLNLSRVSAPSSGIPEEDIEDIAEEIMELHNA